MKRGTFILGGIAGAMLAMMVKRSPTMSAMCASMGRRLMGQMGGMKEKAMGKGFEMNWMSSAFNKEKAGKASGKSFGTTGGAGEGLGEVAELASRDKSVQNEIRDILSENGQERV